MKYVLPVFLVLSLVRCGGDVPFYNPGALAPIDDASVSQPLNDKSTTTITPSPTNTPSNTRRNNNSCKGSLSPELNVYCDPQLALEALDD